MHKQEGLSTRDREVRQRSENEFRLYRAHPRDPAGLKGRGWARKRTRIVIMRRYALPPMGDKLASS